jgi:hypothetical protein
MELVCPNREEVFSQELAALFAFIQKHLDNKIKYISLPPPLFLYTSIPSPLSFFVFLLLYYCKSEEKKNGWKREHAICRYMVISFYSNIDGTVFQHSTMVFSAHHQSFCLPISTTGTFDFFLKINL